MADERALPSGGAMPRALGWVGLTLILFLPAQISALIVADRLTSAIGVGNPEREHFALVEAMIGGLLMMIVVPISGRVLGQSIRLWAGLTSALPIVLAAVANYVLFEDVRSGHSFETDHALPEIFIPMAVLLLASAGIGRRLAMADLARRAWTWVSLAAAAVIVWLVALTGVKMATAGGDFALDSPMTVLVLVAVGAYAVSAVVTNRAR